MQRQLAGCLTFVGWMLSSGLYALDACPHAYDRILPWEKSLGQENVQLTLRETVQLNYNCVRASARSNSAFDAQFYELPLNLLSADAEAFAGDKGPMEASAQVLVLGYEMARRDFVLDELLDVKLSPLPELDVSGSFTIDVGPVPVPVQYGVAGSVEVGLKAHVVGFGAVLTVSPRVDSDVYVRAGVDVGIAKAHLQGDMRLLDDELEAKLGLSFEDSDRSYLRYDINVANELAALSGKATLEAQAGAGIFKRRYQKELFSWKGFERDDKLLEYSDRIPLF